MKRAALTLVVLAVAAMCLVGCTHNQLDIAQDGTLSQDTSTANVSRMLPDQGIVSAFHGVGPGMALQDADGNWVSIPGPFGLLTIQPDGRVFLETPADATMEGVEYTPQPAAGQPAFKCARLSFNISDPLKQHVAALGTVMPILKDMTQAEATATVERMKAAGEITGDLAGLIIQYIIPLLK